jgi:hypothetical protein
LEIAVAKLKKYKLPFSNFGRTDSGTTAFSQVVFGKRKNLPDQWKESIIVSVHKKGDKLTAIIIMGYHCYQLHRKCFCISYSKNYRVSIVRNFKY